jgi:hypothetical protein
VEKDGRRGAGVCGLSAWIHELGGEGRDEALWRFGQRFSRWNKVTCWAAPRMQVGIGLRRSMRRRMKVGRYRGAF